MLSLVAVEYKLKSAFEKSAFEKTLYAGSATIPNNIERTLKSYERKAVLIT